MVFRSILDIFGRTAMAALVPLFLVSPAFCAEGDKDSLTGISPKFLKKLISGVDQETDPLSVELKSEFENNLKSASDGLKALKGKTLPEKAYFQLSTTFWPTKDQYRLTVDCGPDSDIAALTEVARIVFPCVVNLMKQYEHTRNPFYLAVAERELDFYRIVSSKASSLISKYPKLAQDRNVALEAFIPKASMESCEDNLLAVKSATDDSANSFAKLLYVRNTLALYDSAKYYGGTGTSEREVVEDICPQLTVAVIKLKLSRYFAVDKAMYDGLVSQQEEMIGDLLTGWRKEHTKALDSIQ